MPLLEPAHNVRLPQCLSRFICFIATMRLKTLRYAPKEPCRGHRKLRYQVYGFLRYRVLASS